MLRCRQRLLGVAMFATAALCLAERMGGDEWTESSEPLHGARKISLAQVKQRSEAASSYGQENYLTWCFKCIGAQQDNNKGPAVALAVYDNMKWIWFGIAVASIITGAILLILGLRWLPFTLCTIGFLFGFLPSFSIACGVLGEFDMSHLLASLIAVGIGVAPGLLTSCFFHMCSCCSLLLVGASGGLLLAIMLNAWALHFLYDMLEVGTAGYVALGVNITFALIGLLLACFRHGRWAVVWTTAFGGAYLMTWGLCDVIRGTGETSIATRLNPVVLFSGEKSEASDWITFVALGAMTAAGMIGCIVQFKCTARPEDDDNHGTGYHDSHAPLMGDDSKHYA